MNFPVTLFRSDLKKNELFISMSQNSNSQLPYSQIQEIRISQLDDDNSQPVQSQQSQSGQNEIQENNIPMEEIDIDKEVEREIELDNAEYNNETQSEESREDGNTSKKYDFKNAFINYQPQSSDMIQQQNTLKKFVNRYSEILGDTDFESLERILLRIFYERLMMIYHFTRSYNIIYPKNALDQGTVVYLKENMDRFVEKFQEALFNSYLDIVNQIPDDLKALMPEYQVEGNERVSEMNLKTLQEHLRNNVFEMKERMHQLPERFLTALLFRYMYGVCVLPFQFREYIDLLLTDGLVPYMTGEKYVNEILFMGYWQSVPNNVIAEPRKIKEVIEELLNSKDKMKKLAERTVVELIKGKKAARTVNQGSTLTSLTNANMRLLKAINKRNRGELRRKYIEKRGDDDGEATRYMTEVEQFRFDETKPKKFGQQIYINIEDTINILSEALENEDERTLYSLFDIKHTLDWEKEKEKKGQSHFYFTSNYKK